MIFDMPSCGGCRTCEMACSFKHKAEFIPAVSSLKILQKENGPGFIVSLADDNDGQRMACDGCKETAVPLCMQYCEKSEALEIILNQFHEKRKP